MADENTTPRSSLTNWLQPQNEARKRTEPSGDSKSTKGKPPSPPKKKKPPSVSPKKAPKASAKSSPKARSPKTASPKVTPSGMLEGRAVCFTGVFEQKTRSEFEEEGKINGLALRSAVSGKTDYLVYGHILEDGREVNQGSKFKKGTEIVEGRTKGILRMFSESEWIAFVEEHVSSGVPSLSNTDTATITPMPQVTPPLAYPSNTSNDRSLWVDEYRPSTMDDIISNNVVVRNLYNWLKDWDEVILGGNLKPPKEKKGRFGDVERINARAAILSGTPGIGKTSAAKAVAAALNMQAIELNSSDQRAAKDVDALVKLTLNGRNLVNMFKKETGAGNDKTVIIFDEMDGLSASDRGGAASLSKLIEATKIPIICICNDNQIQSLKPVIAKCYELKFNKPNINDIEKRLSAICATHGLQVEKNAMLEIVTRNSNDIRATLNELQSRFMSLRNSHPNGPWAIRYTDVTHMSIKDANMSTNEFDITRILLTRSSLQGCSMIDRAQLFFTAHDLMPKFMHQNYIHSIAGIGGWGLPASPPKLSDKETLRQLESVMRGAMSLSKADLMQDALWRKQNWSLLPDIGFLSTVFLSYKCANSLQRAMFPESLGKQSSKRKNGGLLRQVTHSVASARVNISPRSMRTSGYLDALYIRAIEPLVKLQDPNAAIVMFNELGISRDILIDNILELRLKSQDKLYEKLDTATKTQLTRLANAQKKEFDVPEKAKGTSSPKAKAKSRAKAKRTPKPKKRKSPD